MSDFKNANPLRSFGIECDSSTIPAYINQRAFLVMFALIWMSIFAGGYITPFIEDIVGFKIWGTNTSIFIIAMMLLGYAAALVYYVFLLPERFQLFRSITILLPVLFFSLVAGGLLLVGLASR